MMRYQVVATKSLGYSGVFDAVIDSAFAPLQDFCHGAMQLLQGAVDVRSALHCTIPEEVYHVLKSSSAAVASEESEQKQQRRIQPCTDARSAVVVPACLIKLAMAQVRSADCTCKSILVPLCPSMSINVCNLPAICRAQHITQDNTMCTNPHTTRPCSNEVHLQIVSAQYIADKDAGKDAADEGSSNPSAISSCSLQLILEANRMRLNWCNAADSGLWETDNDAVRDLPFGQSSAELSGIEGITSFESSSANSGAGGQEVQVRIKSSSFHNLVEELQ